MAKIKAKDCSIGIFWEDAPKPKKQETVKIIPPPVWLNDDYLPGLDDAKRFDIKLINDFELVQLRGSSFTFDIETFKNYSLFAAIHEESENVIYFESFNDSPLDIPKLKWTLQHFTFTGFNSYRFDIPVTNLMLSGCTNEQIKEAANLIIESELRPDDIYSHFNIEPLQGIDHIDLISLVPKDTSLKLCGGRIHTTRMQDLPYPPDRVLTRDQADIIRWYCINDLRTTLDLKRTLKEQLDLRVAMSEQYQVDLRSKSDAQIAETVISKAVSELNGYRARRPVIAPGTVYKFQPLHYLNYKSDLMKWVYSQVLSADFIVSETGSILMPEALADLKINIGKSVYKMGIGGLHSTEESVSHKSDDEYVLIDRDVASYYPNIILNRGLFPHHLGKHFLTVYNNIVVGRLQAKREAARLQKEINNVKAELVTLRKLIENDV